MKTETQMIKGRNTERAGASAPSRQAERLAMRLRAWSDLLNVNRLASDPSGVTAQGLYNANKLMLEISRGLADEARILDNQ